ncbi:MAG: PilT protein [uncultured bacterium]|uniref:PIN domain-containing protein n=1 Tax=Candidatus Daviesbacteria bacterium GW2011_GWC2_40_12 TaxID=1618431 RepID=A0A0G0T578_9BACT|nr:MAG: PilT protein [uncultured bacterium]KKQ84341.1 MAG: hypothetical protein UT04_C0017G0012 [Candidatus Daviesbacteria bacterium GW2011_GWF2_38_7]KKR16367.1 MAG: hypothetical protein UT45_C0006G0042 [Candidatus Daviesbacteria bacterium GW2011_GWA2_39_33]KKR23465.1 MAG: hypothetical protein UT54_C0047G0002 [Candidatus Daviesbacteria bacterium GW2011_GWB1_39_5]KKR42260.1 MAG: hypothetical protein UT77_C0003G0055 [Candidatus Daviesbacteria bacterium GW2011_GWC2_40_12]OGE22003.1 MAG: hypotheti
MIFVDTNYFLRFLLKDVENQYQDAKKLFLQAVRGETKLFSSTVVFFEIFWVLRSTYKKDKQALVEKLEMILGLNIVFDQHQFLAESVHLFKQINLSLEDCYNLTIARAKGAQDFKTFDIKLAKVFGS